MRSGDPVEDRTEQVGDTHTAAAVVEDSNLAVAVVAEVDHYKVGSDNLAVGLDCKAGWGIGQEAVLHTEDIVDRILVVEQEDDTAAAEAVGHMCVVIVARCKDTQAEAGDLAVVQLASLAVCMSLAG